MSDPKNAAHRVSIKCICVAKEKVLMLHLIDKHRTLVGGGVDEGEDIITTMKREFFEETGIVWGEHFCPELLHVEIKQFPQKGMFSASINVFYRIKFSEILEVIPEQGIYGEYSRFTAAEIDKLPVSDHFNKEVVLKALQEDFYGT